MKWRSGWVVANGEVLRMTTSMQGRLPVEVVVYAGKFCMLAVECGC